VYISDEVELLEAWVLRVGHLQAVKAVALIFRCPTQLVQLLLDHNRRLNICKDNCSISSIVQPNALDLGRAYNLLAEPSEFGLLVHEEESALHDSEAAAGKGRSAHELDHIIGREFFTPSCLSDEGETIRLTVNALLVDGSEEEFGFVCVLEDYTRIPLVVAFVNPEADTMLQRIKVSIGKHA
jgi:hypothetical protein